MAAIPHHWHAYARLQSRLAASRCVSHGSALEDALNVIHDPAFTADGVTELEIARAESTAWRRQRRRTRLLRNTHGAALDESVGTNEGDVVTESTYSLEGMLDAREALEQLAGKLRPQDWEVLLAVADGASYREVATHQRATVVAIRTRVCRLRQTISAQLGNESTLCVAA